MATQVQGEIIREVLPAIRQMGAGDSASGVSTVKIKKKLVRRTDRDYSQIVRRGFQGAFFLLNIWMGAEFYYWVRQFEPGGAATSLQRPAGVEGWLPIAALMNLKYWLVTHQVPALHPAGMFLLISFLAMSFLFRKSFCSWLCPVGTLSESLWMLGKKLFGRTFDLPPGFSDRLKERITELEKDYRNAHLERLRQGLRESFETSAIHLDLLSNIERINTHITHIAYTLIEKPGPALVS